MREDAKLEGYVLRNQAGKLMTRKKFWASEDMTGGWIWSEQEVAQILKESQNWEIKPTHKQAAYLARGNVTVIIGELEKVTP